MPARNGGWQDGSVRRLLLLGSTVVFLDVVFYTAITPLLPDYVDDLGLSKAAAGVLSAAYAAGTLIASLPAGLDGGAGRPAAHADLGAAAARAGEPGRSASRITCCCSTPPASSRAWPAPWPGPAR